VKIVRTGLLLVASTGAGCAAATFINDVTFLKRHTEVIVLESSRIASGRAVACPELDGCIVTSTAAGAGGRSFGWINRPLVASGHDGDGASHGGEDCLSVLLEGAESLENAPFNVSLRSSERTILRKTLAVPHDAAPPVDVEIVRELRILEGDDPGKLLGVLPGEGVRWVGFQSRNTVRRTRLGEASEHPVRLRLEIVGRFLSTPSTRIALPRRGPLGSGTVYLQAEGSRRQETGLPQRFTRGLAGAYDPRHGVLTIIQFSVHEDGDLSSQTVAPLADEAVTVLAPARGASEVSFFEIRTATPPLDLRPLRSVLHVRSTFHFQGSRGDLDKISRGALNVGLDDISEASE
jgi:hypothetical protein